MGNVFSKTNATIFDSMSSLARQHNAVNLGQGFPDDQGPHILREKAADEVINGWNQYPPMMGTEVLRQAIARHYSAKINASIDWATETLVTSGATEALAASIFALVEPGDEVILFQPFYDAYLPLILRAGGIPRFVSLNPKDWSFEHNHLRNAFSPRTRAIILNDPLNPAAICFTSEQRALIVHLCIEHNVVAICDEVWEEVIFGDQPHQSLMAFPEMREKAIKIGSAGKMFSLTGWKIGFVVANPSLLSLVAKAHQFLTFTTPPNLQSAAALGLERAAELLPILRARLNTARSYFTEGLQTRGFVVLPSNATYFLNVDIGNSNLSDIDFCRRLVTEFGVAAIPVSAFFATDPSFNVVRFCFAKQKATLDEALKRLDVAVAALLKVN
jgi:N-succinyldiaminopimelate aminotransferase